MKICISRISTVFIIIFSLSISVSYATGIQSELRNEPDTTGITIQDTIEENATKGYSHLLLTGPKLMFGFDLWNPLPGTANWSRYRKIKETKRIRVRTDDGHIIKGRLHIMNRDSIGVGDSVIAIESISKIRNYTFGNVSAISVGTIWSAIFIGATALESPELLAIGGIFALPGIQLTYVGIRESNHRLRGKWRMDIEVVE